VNILVVTHNLPLPTWGTGIRSYHLLAALARKHDVTLFSLVDAAKAASRDVPQVEATGAKVRCFELPRGWGKRAAQLQALVRGTSYLMNTYSPAEAQHDIEELVAAEDCDLILFESLLVAGLRPKRAVKIVIDQHNVEHEILQRTFESESSPLRRWYHWAECRALRRHELTLCGSADGVILTSERDRRTLTRLVPLQASAVVPNGVDVDAFAPAADTGRQAGRVVFTGTMGYYPNVQAVLFFAERCWPLIRAQVPDATWAIVGSQPPAEVQRLATLPGVSVTGAVADVRPYLASASVAIAPLRIGGGTRLKILEAFATGTPVVSTSVGCEGLAVTAGAQLLVEDEPGAFAEAVVRLFGDPALRARLGRAGRAIAESQYGWRQVGEQLLAFIESLGAAS
jgi:sugar transferase (PEP-CTERM/EpsH1 system associated)